VIRDNARLWSSALVAFMLALALFIAGHWQPPYCRQGDWWQELWLPGVPVLALLGVGASLIARPRRYALFAVLIAGAFLVAWVEKFVALAGACAD